MVVTNSALSSFTTNTLFFMQSSLSHTLYFSLIVSVIFIFGESGTRICLAFNTIVKFRPSLVGYSPILSMLCYYPIISNAVEK